MGTAKTKLMRGDAYGLLKAAELAAEMIADYENARLGASEMRVEAIDEPSWDDIHVHRGGQVTKWQVKRLMKGFALDDAIELLKTAAATKGCDLHVGLATLVPIMDGSSVVCSFAELAQLCSAARVTGTVPTAFAKRESAKPEYKLVSSAIPAATDDELVALLQRLHIVHTGLEDHLRAQAEGHLRHIFVNYADVVTELHNWFLHHPDGVVLVTPHLLYDQVIDKRAQRDPNHRPWIHLTRCPLTQRWESRGPLKLSELVGRAWGNAGATIQLGTKPFSNEATSSSIPRLVIHRGALSVAEATTADAVAWQSHTTRLCGGTIGISPDAPQFQCGVLGGGPSCPPREVEDDASLAEALSNAMNEAVWKIYVQEVARLLHEDTIAEDLRLVMKKTWAAWTIALTSSSHRASFVGAMLATHAEWKRPSFDNAVRAGLRLCPDLARATIVALAVAAAFTAMGFSSGVGADGAIENARLGTTLAHIIALTSASHPDDHQRASRLSDAPAAMLSDESGIAILGVIDAAASDLYRVARDECVPYHVTDAAAQSYRHPGTPFPLITASPTFRAAMRKGLGELEKHITEILKEVKADRLKSMEGTLNQ